MAAKPWGAAQFCSVAISLVLDSLVQDSLAQDLLVLDSAKAGAASKASEAVISASFFIG